MSVVVVFSDEKDFGLFKAGLPLFNRSVPAGSWTPVISKLPGRFDYLRHSQYISAWKKFFGIAYLMDSPHPPDYGIIADSELLLYDEAECSREDSKWNMFYQRIQAKERTRQWNAVRITPEDTYAFGTLRNVMKSTKAFVSGANASSCTLPQCRHLDDFRENVTFSWWTDLPWMNLSVVPDMLAHIAGRAKGHNETWAEFIYPLKFSRYEHVSYQYWTVLHENFTLRNVTDLTGPTVGMATYTEGENRNGSRVAELLPLWVSDRVREQTEGPVTDRYNHHFAKLESFSTVEPPFLLFHCDLAHRRFKEKNTEWERRVNLSRAP